jgi:hypothetical protein
MDNPGHSAACSSSGFRAGCWSAFSAAGSSSTCWKACWRRWAFLICGIVRSASALKYVVAGVCTFWMTPLSWAPAGFAFSSKAGSFLSRSLTSDFTDATSSSASTVCCNQSRKCWMPTIRIASSTYGSKSVSKPEANMSRRPSSKFTNRASRRPVFCISFQSDFFRISPNRKAAARASSSWPGLTVKYADTSETTPWLLPLPDFLVNWPIVFPLLVLISSLSTFQDLLDSCLKRGNRRIY